MGNGVSSVKKALFTFFLFSAVLVLFVFGKTSTKESLVLDKLSLLITAGGVQVEGYYLEGWAFLQDPAQPNEVWEERKIGEKLGLVDVSKRTISTVSGDCLQVECACRDCQARVVLQKIQEESNNEDKIYISIKYNITDSIQESLSREKKIRETLTYLGKDHGLYLAVKGNIAADLDEEAQLAWGEAIFRDFNAKAADILCTDKYISITGYSPVLPDAVTVGGRKTNLNLSMVRKENGIQVILGTPLITCEY